MGLHVDKGSTLLSVQLLFHFTIGSVPGCKRHEKTQLFPVNHPFIEVECEGVVERTGHIVHMENNPIFPHAILTLQVVCNVKIV